MTTSRVVAMGLIPTLLLWAAFFLVGKWLDHRIDWDRWFARHSQTCPICGEEGGPLCEEAFGKLQQELKRMKDER